MSEEQVVIKFSKPFSRSGGPGWNPGESAAFNRTDADYIINKVKAGDIVRVVPASSKAPSSPPKNKMVEEPVRKKARQRLIV